MVHRGWLGEQGGEEQGGGQGRVGGKRGSHLGLGVGILVDELGPGRWDSQVVLRIWLWVLAGYGHLGLGSLRTSAGPGGRLRHLAIKHVFKLLIFTLTFFLKRGK